MVSAASAGFVSAEALDTLYGSGTSLRVRSARVLVVGAGGVGCELLKNLACAGFGSITVIDLDTIDVSNLNRQFLFRKNHVGKSKAVEAAASIARMVPGTNIQGLVGNIKEPRFGVPFFKSFNLVCNALDNLEARRHVNRMCLAADIPLVESGSTGYNGQAFVIAKGYECYDCNAQPEPKSYAVCTIRSTPEKPVHCVVWAKALYGLIFGPDDDGNVLKDLDGDMPAAFADLNGGAESNPGGENSNGVDESNKENEVDESTLSNGPENGSVNHRLLDRSAESKPKTKRVRYTAGEDVESFASRVCSRVYIEDIETQRAMKNLWKDRDPPVVYDVNAVAMSSSEDVEKVDMLSQVAWTAEKSAIAFRSTLKRIVEKRTAEIGRLTFDKDDRDAMMFVVAASNLRSHAYGVPLQSSFSVKGIAGNIVHAIASTNAIVGGLIVLEALKLTANEGDVRDCLTTFVSKAPVGHSVKKVLYPERLCKKNKNCFVCSKGQLQLYIDVKMTRLRTLVSAVLQKNMSILQPTVNVTTGKHHGTVYECGAGLEEDEVAEYSRNLDMPLHKLRIEDGSQLVVEDFAQNLTCTLHVTHVEELLEDKPELERFKLEGKVEEVQPNENGSAEVERDSAPEDVDDNCEEVPVLKEPASATGASEVAVRKEVNEVAVVGEVNEVVVAREEETGDDGGKKRALEEGESGTAEGERIVKRARNESGEPVTADRS